MYLRHQTYTLYYRGVCILVFLHVFAYFMLLRCMLKFKRLACVSDDVTQYNSPTALLFQNFGIRVQIRFWQFFKFEIPTPVQTPATIINSTLIYPCFYLRNDHTDPCSCQNWKVTPGPGPCFPKFSTPGPVPGPKKTAESGRSRLR